MAKSGNSSGLTRSEYVKLRSQGYSSEEIKNNYNGSNSSEQGKSSGSANTNKPLTRAEYVKLRSKGYTKEEINKINKPKKRWVTEETAENAFNSWGSSIDKYQDWAKKQSSYLADWDTTQASYWSNIFTQNAKQANDYLKRLEEAGIRKGNEEYDAYKDYYDYFNDAANGLNANNNSFYDYREKYMYNAGNGNYYTYDQAKQKEKQLREEAETARNAPKKVINTGLGGFIDPESIQSEKEAKDKDAQADAYAKWLAKQDEQKAQSDWLTRNLGRGQDSEQVYQGAAARMADAESKRNDLLSRRPDYYSYGQSDEMGNVYAYDDAAYSKAKNAWDNEYNKFMQEEYAPAQRDYRYATDVRDMSVIQNANVDSPEVRAVINRGKAMDPYAGYDSSVKPVKSEGLTFQTWLDNLAAGMGGNSAAGTGAGRPITGINSTMAYGSELRKHVDISTWSTEKANTYYYLLGSGQTESAERFAKLTNDAIAGQQIAMQVYKPMDEWQAAHPIIGGVAATAAGIAVPLVTGIPEYLAAVDEYLVTGEINPSGIMPSQLAERGISNTANQLNEWSGTINENAPVIGGKGAGDLYQVALSAAQSYLSISMAGGMEAATLAQFFGSAASSKIYESLENGMDPGKALALGTLSGTAEVLGEKLSIENLIKIGDSKTARALIKNILVQAGIEGSEEAFTNILNTLSDFIVNGDKNALQIAMDSYVSQGMDTTAAEKQAIKDWLNEIGYDAVSGALSGAMGATGQSVRANVGRYQGNVVYLNDLASQTAEGSRSRQMAEEYGSRDRLSKFRGNQYAAQVQEDLVNQNTETAVRAIEQRLTELGETGNVHQKAQFIANSVISDMAGEEAGGWGMTPSNQYMASDTAATANMKKVMKDIATARQQYIDYGRPNSEWTDPIVKGRFLDERVLSRDLGATINYAQGRDAQKNLEKHTSQIADLEKQITEAKKELGRLSPTDTTRRRELNAQITEAENKLKDHQAAILNDGYNSYTEKEKAASVKIDGKEYNVSGLTMEKGNAQITLTDTEGNTMNVSMDDERLPDPIRSLAIKANSLGWAASAAFKYYKPGTNISEFIRQVQNAKAFASEKINRDAFMNLGVVKAMDNMPMAEFLYGKGQDLYNARQSAIEMVTTVENKIVQAAQEKKGDLDNIRTKGKGRVDITSGWTFSDGRHFEGIQGKQLTKTQNSIVKMVSSLADALNIDYVIYDGDAKGVLGVSQEGGVIAININAGMNVKRALAAETLSHELTHFQENFAPEEYEALRVAVVNAAYNKNAALFEERVQAQMRLLPDTIKGDAERYDAAVREVVADACTTMLKNSKVVTEIARENMTLAEKMADFIEQTINNIKQAIAEAYADSDPAYYRKEVSLISDRLDEIQKLWDEGLRAAAFNYNALQTMKGETDLKSFSIQQFMENASTADQLQMNESDEGTVSVDANPVVSSLVNTMKPHNGASLIQYQMATENEAMPKQIFSVGGDSMMLTDADGKNLSFSVRDIRDAVARANGMSDANIAKVNGFLDELGTKMKDYELKYQFVGLKDIEDAKILLDRDGKIILSAMVKNNEYAVNFDFTKLCKKRQALQKVIENLAREKGRVTENGGITEVNLTAGNVQHINELLAAAGVETNCLGCFVEAKRANQQQLNGYIINDWNAIVDELYPNAKYFNFADKTGDVNLHDSTTDKEAFEKYREALRQLGEEKKKQRKSITPVEKARLLIENVPAARFKLKYSDLATENGRTRLHQEFPEIDSYAKSRLGTASFKTVESFAPYNAEIELLGQGASIKVKDGKITVKKDNGNLRKQLAKIAGVRSQSFSDFIVSHVYDVMQKTAALSARGLPAHTYTKEISRARLFGMTGEKHNLSVLLEVDPSVDSWSAGLTQNGDFFAGDYQHFALKEGQIGKAHFIQSIGLEDAKKLQNTEGYSKNCGIIVVPLSYNAYIKALNDPEMRMIIGYHSSGMPVDVKSKTHYDMAADYQGVQNTQKVVRLVKPNYAIPEGIPSYATPPGDVVPLDGKSKTLRSDMSFDIKARFEELAKGKTGNERTAAAKQTLQEFLDFMNENGLTAETTKSENGYGKFPLYDDVQQTRDPYLTADHYIEYCIEKGELPLFWEFATNQNYYKQVFDFNMFDRLSYNEKTGRHESSPTREAYAPQVAVQLLDNNGDLLVPRDFFDLLDKYMKDYNNQMKAVSSVVPEVIEKVKADRNIVSISDQHQVAEAEAEDNAPAVAESMNQYQVWTDDPPKKVQYGFKLMNVDENGLPHAMFIDAANPYELGQWYTADSPKMENLIGLEPGYAYLVDENDIADMESRRPVQKVNGAFRGLPGVAAVNQATLEGKRWMVVDQYADGSKSIHNAGINGSGTVSTFAIRPGIHAVDIPSMAHIGSKSKGSSKIDSRRPNQAWFLIEYPVDVDYNQEAFSHQTKDIREHLPEKGWYSYQTNSGAEARQHWFITGGMRVVGMVSEADARRYAREHGFEEDLPWKMGKSYDEAANAIDLDNYIKTTTAKPTPSKAEMARRIAAGTTDQYQRYDGIEDAAKEHFGTTEDYRTAGYILQDGTMLDFSGAHWLEGYDDKYIADWRSKNDIRQVDHEDIFEAFEQMGADFPSDSRKAFIDRGNIRFSPEAPGINISDRTKLTNAQYQRIKDFIRTSDMDRFYVDIEGNRGRLGKLEYSGKINADRVVNDIRNFYETGETRQSSISQFHDQFQMYDNTADDSMFEAEERQKAWNDLQAENAVLEDTVTQLRKEIEKLTKQAAQLKRTDKPEVRMNDARKMARQIIKDTRPEPITTRDKMEIRELTNRLSQQIKEIGDYILETGKNPNEIDYSEIRSMAQDIARDIVNNAEVEIDDGAGTKDMRDEMRAALRNRPIFVPEQYRSDVLDWNDFKKRYRNIFTFKDSGTDIDIVYQSLLEEIPGLLDPNINNPGDMLNELADKWDVLQPKYENPFDDFTNEAINHYTNMILQGALDGTLRQIEPSYADRMNERIARIREDRDEKVEAAIQQGRDKVKALREYKNARIEEIYHQGITRKQEALAREREAKWAKVEEANRIGRARVKALRTYKNERIQATRKYYQDMRERASIRRKNSETRTKIKGLINDMNSRLLHGTEKKYVPAHLVENTVRILEMIDLDTGRENVKLQERLALLQQQYAALKNDQTFASYAYDPILENLITDMARTVGDTPLRNMNNTQLEKVYQTLRELEHTIRTAVKDKLYGEEINFYESARATAKATNAISGSSANALGKASNWYLTNTMRPDVVFERFGGFAKDSEWTKIADMLNRAQRYGMDLQLKFSQPFEELLKDKKNLAKLTSTKAEDMVDIGLKDENGESIKITRDFMLFTYMNLFNEDNIQHVMRGGITVPALKEYLAGRGDRGYGIGSRHAVGISQRLSDINHAIEDSTDANEKAALLQEKEDVLKEGMEYINNLRENIEKNLTKYDQKWIDAWWKFNKMATDVLNETTMNTYGIKKFLVERYFPIITDRNYLNVPMETIIKDMSLENAGFTKERIHASNPIKMMGLADLINMQANRTAQYASIMPAVRAFNKIYNKTMPGYSTSVKSALNSKFGSEATKFIENLMADLQGGRHSDFTIFDRLRGRMAQATLSLNPRVALAQTASFPTAAAELGWKPVMKALARGGKNNALISAADRELIQKWSSALWYRSRGYNSVELGDVKNMQQAQHKVMDKLGWAMNWINFMDSATVGRLWYAAQYYVDEKNPELQKGSDAYYEKVAEAFNRTIENTQPNYTTMQRPELLRNPNALIRQLSMFMTQRLQNQSILYGAVAKYMKYRADLASGKNGVTQADVNEMGKRAAWAASSQIAAAATITVFKFLCDALLHRLNAYRRDEDKKLTPESVSLAMLNNFAESLASNMFLGSEIYAATKSAITKETYYGIELSGVTTLTDNINNAVKFVQQPSWGLAKKLGESLAQFYGIPAANAEKIGQAIWYWMEDAMKGEFMEAGVERTDAMNAKLLTEAYASGDKKAIEKYSGTFEDDDDLLDSVRSYVKTGYVNKDKQTISKTEAVKLLVQAGTRQKDAEAKVQEWTCELVTGIPFSKIKDEFMAGNITQSRVIELLQKYGGRDKETAERTARSYACEKETGHPYTDLKEAYILGEVSRSVLEKAVKKYGGMNAEDTQNKLYYYDYLKENPTSDLNENRAVAYMTKLKPAGIKAKDYEDILNKADTDKNGAYTQNEVGSWLENKGYSKTQAEALWSAMGPTWKTGFDAWQVKYKADLAGNKNNNVSQKELGPYLVQQINSGKMSLEEAEGYWKVFFSKSSTTFKKWLKKNRYKLG